jgi:vitamin B12 transporter
MSSSPFTPSLFTPPLSRRSPSAATVAATTLTAAVVAGLAAPATAQVATSPDVVQVPAVTATPPATAPAPATPPSAPRAAQQGATPRATPRATRRTPAPASPTSTSTPAAAEAAAPRPEDVGVAPTGLAQPVEQSGSAVTVITDREIDARQARSAPDVLKTVPGLDVVQTGGPGGTTSIFTRGTNSNHTKVFIDGIDVSNPFDANRTFDFGLLQAYDLARVEVLRGPQSGLYGADALGGVIVLYTKEGDGPPTLEALAEGGSFDTFNQAVSARGSSGPVRYAFNVSHTDIGAIPVTPPALLAPGGTGADYAYENWTFSTKLGVDVLPALAVNVAARYVETDYAFLSDLADPRLSTTATEQLYTRAEVVGRAWGGRLTSIAGIAYTEVDSDTRTPSFGDTIGTGMRTRADWRTVATLAPGVVAVVGADRQNERLTQPGLAVEEESGGVYVQGQVEPIPDLFLVGNVRHDTNENFDAATTWRIAATAVGRETGTTFRVSAGTAFKAPSLTQRFQDFPAFFFFANRNLQPEESRGMDIGVEQALFRDRMRIGATYFRNTITDLIEFSFDPVTFTSTVINVGAAETSGIEAFAAVDLSDTVRLRADYTYTAATNEVTGADLLRRPRHKAALALGWQALPPLLVTTTLRYVGERADVDRVTFATVDQPGFVTVDVAGEYALDQRVSLIGRVDNILDERYDDPNGFLRPGLGAYVGVRVRN